MCRRETSDTLLDHEGSYVVKYHNTGVECVCGLFFVFFFKYRNALIFHYLKQLYSELPLLTVLLLIK